MNQYKLVCRCDRQTVVFQNWCSNQALIVVVVIKYKTYCNCLTDFPRTTDRDSRCFYPCEIILCHTPIPAHGKDKKRSAARRLHAANTSIRVITMLHLSVFRIFWKLFPALQYKMMYFVVSKKKNPLFV